MSDININITLEPVDINISVGLNSNDIDVNIEYTISKFIGLVDTPDNYGVSGQILSSDGSDLIWSSAGSGDMLKSTYDIDSDGIVDKAETVDDGAGNSSTAADVKDSVTKKHEHSNKSLLDTYTQIESDLSDAVSKKHDHSNKALLDTYTQTESDIGDAVSKKHEHTYLLDLLVKDIYLSDTVRINLDGDIVKIEKKVGVDWIEKFGVDLS